mmetsp:Transcript_2357/g.6053  ORF Transcript_2357/g.6053 Transcript_2357/m.6053 type:complete len:205 (-) Transcript_2357:690-1304(-)
MPPSAMLPSSWWPPRRRCLCCLKKRRTPLTHPCWGAPATRQPRTSWRVPLHGSWVALARTSEQRRRPPQKTLCAASSTKTSWVPSLPPAEKSCTPTWAWIPTPTMHWRLQSAAPTLWTLRAFHALTPQRPNSCAAANARRRQRRHRKRQGRRTHLRPRWMSCSLLPGALWVHLVALPMSLPSTAATLTTVTGRMAWQRHRRKRA